MTDLDGEMEEDCLICHNKIKEENIHSLCVKCQEKRSFNYAKI